MSIALRVVAALLADGAVADPAVVEKLAEELILAHLPYLPQFA